MQDTIPRRGGERVARGRPGLLTRLLVPSQPSRYRWHAESSPGTDVSQSPSFSPCLFWEVHLTASSLSRLLQFLLLRFALHSAKVQ